MDISIRKRKIISKCVFFEAKFNFEEFFHGIARKNISHTTSAIPKECFVACLGILFLYKQGSLHGRRNQVGLTRTLVQQ